MKINKIALSAALAALLMTPAALSAEDTEAAYQESTAEALGIEISGDIYIDYGIYTGSGQTYNPLLNDDGTAKTHDAGDATRNLMKANLYINGEVGEESSWHAQLQAITDTEAIDGYRNFRNNSQFEAVRELYFDTRFGDLEMRIGKQQVVWGKADGVKFLDIVNPTDFRYWAQSSMEDSRIPLWMLTAEYPIGDNGSLQLIWVPDVETGNQIPGLLNTTTGDQGQPFVSLGAETLTGQENGFLNIARDMGQTASIFQTLLGMGGMRGLTGPMKYRTVEWFTGLNQPGNTTFQDVKNSGNNAWHELAANGDNVNVSDDVLANGFDGAFINACFGDPSNPTQNTVNLPLLNQVFIPMVEGMGNGDNVLNAAANNGTGLFGGFQNYFMGYLMPTSLAVAEYASASETEQEQIQASSSLLSMMGITAPDGSFINLSDDATRAYFAQMLGSMTPEQIQEMMNTPQMQYITGIFGDGTTNQFDGTFSDGNPTSMFDYMGNTAFGTFYYFQGMQTVYRVDPDGPNKDDIEDHNLGLRYAGSTDGGLNYSFNYYYHWDNNPYIEVTQEDSAGRQLTSNFQTYSAVPAYDAASNTFVAWDGAQQVTALESMTYSDGTAFTGPINAQGMIVDPVTLVFNEKRARISTIGGSFDYAIDNNFAPIIVRGELVYDHNVKTNVIDKAAMSYGDMTGAIKVNTGDFFKYVIGLDMTVLTNLFMSFQFMDTWNLDYVDDKRAYNGKEYDVYTVNPATMSLGNGFKAGEEHQIMYTFFLSKPFMESDALRVNNLFLLENEDYGWWNRLDAEYSWSDSLLFSAAWNQYGGDRNGVFGQFEDMSNVQIGAKLIF